jgi:hypothetical protein
MRMTGLSALHSFFLKLTRQTFSTLGVGGPAAAEYVSEVCARFARSDTLYALSDEHGHRLTDLVAILEETGLGMGRGERDMSRYVGDFALFMSGLFHRYIAERGVLELYYQTGASAYRQAAGVAPPPDWPPPHLLLELALRFEHYAGALDFMRQAHFAASPGEDPYRQFLARLEVLTGGVSRN